ncbi:MAG: hypothetical protein QM784_08120 [Polyangiaceae bacterium]
MSSMIERELIRATREKQSAVRALTPADSAALRERVVARYAKQPVFWPLWENFRFPFSVQNPDGWKEIGKAIGASACFLFLNPSDGLQAFECDSGSQLNDLLADTYGFEFYVTNSEVSYLFCFNHHDMLLAAGTAVLWMEAKSLESLVGPRQP